jgi:mRNA interferase RelE/StbE
MLTLVVRCEHAHNKPLSAVLTLVVGIAHRVLYSGLAFCTDSGTIVGMTYAVEFEAAAAKQLLRIDRGQQKRIRTAVADLGQNPRPHGAVKLSGLDAFRIRVGDYRVVYVIDDAIRIVTVTRVAKRGEVYRRL